ncbi:methyl-accepting chemotaxis protein [Brevibacillus ruminantium]|uniref:Methyl-accepting chemotaxis protein n=1 Tax=Brevibacillus ruminantium TaxID=2950604 RepID=A0ABY4WI40_9BACL|nr:methyl-accepting chemotaxis protein [Brevibacillus ruminantium]USG65014.1 methyl-accepting chemotaxis protein [Brevibacillus ruminantium]
MSIKWKNVVAVAVIFVSFIVIQLFQYVTSEAHWRELKKVEDQTLKAALLADELKISVIQVQQWFTDISATRGKDGLDDGFDIAEKYAKLFHEKLDEMAQIYPEEAEMLQEAKASFDRYYDMGKKMANHYIEGGHEKGNQIMGDFDKTAEDINQRIDNIRDSKLSEITQSILNIETNNKANNQLSLVFFLTVILIGIAVVYVHSRAIINPLKRLIADTKRIAAGDLTSVITVSSKDEIGQLSTSFEVMRVKLAELIGRINITSQQVATSTEELTAGIGQTTMAADRIAAAMEEVSNNSEIQAKGTSESSKAIEEMAIGVHRIAEISGEVAELSSATAKAAYTGNQSIQLAISKMDTISDAVHQSASVVTELGERSKEINQIIEVITEITNQTNLLALNAAIEASRAGEQGRGFAVVAGEVKKLAEQSKQSAEMISDMIRLVQEDTAKAVRSIEQGTREVEEGKSIVNEAGEVFRCILQDAENTASQIQEVSAATEEMSAGSEQISASITGLNDMAKVSFEKSRGTASHVQEQLASMEGISEAVHKLSDMAQELNELVHTFKVEGSEK